MSGFDYTATGILNRIRDLSYAGNSIRDWDDTKILRLVNAEVYEYLVPMILTARKNHFDTYKDQALVASQAGYYLPTDASAMKVRAVLLVDSAGNAYAPLQERELEDFVGFGSSFLTGTLPAGIPQVYCFQGNQLLLFPTPSGSPAGLSLRIHYARRPSALVTNASCVQITALPGGSTVTVASGSIPSSGYSNTSAVDVVQNNPGFDLLLSSTISSQTATSIVFGATVPSTVAIGDWVCVSGTAPVITGSIPEMAIGCLLKKCVLEILSGKADDAAFKRTAMLMQMDEKRAHQFLNRRNTGDRPKAGIGSLYKFKRGYSGYP